MLCCTIQSTPCVLVTKMTTDMTTGDNDTQDADRENTSENENIRKNVTVKHGLDAEGSKLKTERRKQKKWTQPSGGRGPMKSETRGVPPTNQAVAATAQTVTCIYSLHLQ